MRWGEGEAGRVFGPVRLDEEAERFYPSVAPPDGPSLSGPITAPEGSYRRKKFLRLRMRGRQVRYYLWHLQHAIRGKECDW